MNFALCVPRFRTCAIYLPQPQKETNDDALYDRLHTAGALMANGHGGRRAGAGRKIGEEPEQLRNLARRLCADGLEEMARLSLEATSESVRTRAFDRLLKVAYGKEMREEINSEPREVVEIVRWAETAAEAIPDPARRGND